MSRNHLRVIVHIDGGARGNPGPAGAGVVMRDAEDGSVLQEAGFYLGRATNNVAEYRGLLCALAMAAELDAAEVEAVSDSELLVRQMTGVYRVRNAALKSLFAEAQSRVAGFRKFSIRHVRREQNVQADDLVNRAINRKQNVEGAAGRTPPAPQEP